jgi:hypothetical protein
MRIRGFTAAAATAVAAAACLIATTGASAGTASAAAASSSHVTSHVTAQVAESSALPPLDRLTPPDSGVAAPGPAIGHRPNSSTACPRGIYCSTIWAGYTAFGNPGSVYSVSATWVEPAVNCRNTGWEPRKPWDVYFWVGIDGAGNGTVEQDGTAAICWHDRPYYYLWYEFFPHYPVMTKMPTVRAGDHIAAYAVARGHTFYLRVTDLTNHQAFGDTSTSDSAQRSTGEVVAEAPGGMSDKHHMPDFGKVYFTNAYIDRQPISRYGWPTVMYTNDGRYLEAVPSRIGSGGTYFSVRWLRPY